MKTPFYQLDAFTRKAFGGNPAAVCPLEKWLDDDLLLAIARENNLSETAFTVRDRSDNDTDFHLRWFTPGGEVDLCGHATLAAGYVMLEILKLQDQVVSFSSRSGPLGVSRDGDKLMLDFPNRKPAPAAPPKALASALNIQPRDILLGADNYLLVYGSSDEVLELKPDFPRLLACGAFGFLATAPGEDCAFVSRCFFPHWQIDEDPVTGSAHCTSGPYWAEKLGKPELFARQISVRGGELWLRVSDDRVAISGHVVPVIEGTLTL